MNRVYLAARYSRHPEMQEYAKRLEGIGHTVTSRWIHGNHQIPEGTAEGERYQESVRFAVEDYNDVVDADYLVIFTDPPRTTTRGGKHVEVGIALGSGMPVYMVGTEIENIFYYLPCITRFPTFDDLLAFLEQEAIYELQLEEEKAYYGRV